jgi:type I restriction enzyme S subunit
MCRRIFKEQTSETGDIPFFKIGTFGGVPDAYISRELFGEYRTKFPYPKVGDILISASGSIGRTVEYIGKDEYFQDSNIVWLNHDERIDNSFLKYFYAVVRWAGIEGSTIKRLYNDNILNTEIRLPSVDEQQQIGSFFRNVDHLITLHQRKLEKAKNLKKSLLSEMFPTEGERKPKRRFPGFTGDWEQRKAEDVADYSKGSGYSKKDLRDKGTPIILYGRLYTNYQFFISDVDAFSEKKSGAVVSEGNEVIVPASGETAEDIARASAVVESGIIIGGDLNILRPFESIDPLFLALTISNGEPKKQLAGKAKGISIVHIHNSDIQEIVVSFPTKDEQSKIVAVFQHLDHLITLHQRKHFYHQRKQNEC